jgi:hypothetical protein
MNALSSMCMQHEVFLPTFPVERMSRQSLEKAALNPVRFAADLKRCDPGGQIDAPRIQIIKIEQAGEAVVTSLYLVPGGRYLLTAENPHNAMLQPDPRLLRKMCLRDLGYGSESTFNRTPIACLEYDNFVGIMTIHQAPDSHNTIYVFTHEETTE